LPAPRRCASCSTAATTLLAWIITIPASALIAAGAYAIAGLFG
jgi:phosphate/sulfate permease